MRWDDTITSSSSWDSQVSRQTDSQTRYNFVSFLHSESVKKNTHLIRDAILCFVGTFSFASFLLFCVFLLFSISICARYNVHIELHIVYRELGRYTTKWKSTRATLSCNGCAPMCIIYFVTFGFWCIGIETNSIDSFRMDFHVRNPAYSENKQRLRNIYVSSICTIGMCWIFLYTTSRRYPRRRCRQRLHSSHRNYSNAVTKVENPLQSIWINF